MGKRWLIDGQSLNLPMFPPPTTYPIQYTVFTLQSECASHTKMTKSLKKVKLKLKLEPLQSSGCTVYDMSVMLCM